MYQKNYGFTDGRDSKFSPKEKGRTNLIMIIRTREEKKRCLIFTPRSSSNPI